MWDWNERGTSFDLGEMKRFFTISFKKISGEQDFSS